MNDFVEMLIHHIAAVSLYTCYTFGNMFPLGCVIAYLHDLADIPGSLCKLLNSTHYQTSSVVVFLICMVVWFVTRIWSLPQMIYFIFTECQFQGELAPFQPYLTFSGIFLSIMCTLHYYWFMLFFKMLRRFVLKGETNDLQNKVVGSEKKKQ